VEVIIGKKETGTFSYTAQTADESLVQMLHKLLEKAQGMAKTVCVGSPFVNLPKSPPVYGVIPR
jgi:hypothetical protein